MAWIPVTAAGIINGIGHYWGYRNFACADASTNIVPWGILIGGEELHNNHHAYGTSAKLSSRWYEFDIGWMYIRMLDTLGLATVRKVAPQLKLDRTKAMPDLATLQAVITHRYAVATSYARSLKAACADELAQLRERQGRDAGGTAAEPAHDEALAARRSRDADRRRARAPRPTALANSKALSTDLRDAPGARGAVGALDRVVRAAAGPPAGLVPPRRSVGHRAARAVLAPAPPLRLTRRGSPASRPQRPRIMHPLTGWRANRSRVRRAALTARCRASNPGGILSQCVLR